MTLPLPDRPARYRRILLKVSGEVLMGEGGFGIDMKTVDAVAEEISQIVQLGV